MFPYNGENQEWRPKHGSDEPRESEEPNAAKLLRITDYGMVVVKVLGASDVHAQQRPEADLAEEGSQPNAEAKNCCH